MYQLIKKLFTLLTHKQRLELYRLQALIVTMVLLEILGIASIAPFMAMIGDISVLQQNGLLSNLYAYSGMSDPYQFAFWFGIVVLSLLVISTSLSMITIWRLSMFASRTGTDIADRLFKYYMRQDWLFHTNGSSAQLTKQIANESQRVTSGVIQPIMLMNARMVLILAMSVAIFSYNPQVAFTGLTIFVIAYFLLYKTVRKRLHKNGCNVSKLLALRYQLMNEGFGGIKDTLLLGRSQSFINRFQESGKRLACAQGTNVALTQVPRYFMELIAFGSIIGLVLYLFKFYNGDLGNILPVLSVYALVGFKLLPAFQHIYASVASIKANLPAFQAIEEHLIDSQRKGLLDLATKGTKNKLIPQKYIALEKVIFTYPGKSKRVLNQLSLEIPVNHVVGIVGESGSGKSTAIDCLLGLLQPNQGALVVDGKTIDATNIRAWQNSIGFVAQNIFLSEDSIAENVAFGIPKDEIDNSQVRKAIELAHLTELVNQLEFGLDTKVGERGVQLSGGQRQRIGIARALYNEANILIFDEATSALDGITEKIIMNAIHDFHGSKTIIMIAHRLKTLRSCNNIFIMNSGRIVDKGSYDYLIKHNALFHKMSQG